MTLPRLPRLPRLSRLALLTAEAEVAALQTAAAEPRSDRGYWCDTCCEHVTGPDRFAHMGIRCYVSNPPS